MNQDIVIQNIEDEYNSWVRKTKILNLLNEENIDTSYNSWCAQFVKSFKIHPSLQSRSVTIEYDDIFINGECSLEIPTGKIIIKNGQF